MIITKNNAVMTPVILYSMIMATAVVGDPKMLFEELFDPEFPPFVVFDDVALASCEMTACARDGCVDLSPFSSWAEVDGEVMV